MKPAPLGTGSTMDFGMQSERRKAAAPVQRGENKEGHDEGVGHGSIYVHLLVEGNPSMDHNFSVRGLSGAGLPDHPFSAAQTPENRYSPLSACGCWGGRIWRLGMEGNARLCERVINLSVRIGSYRHSLIVLSLNPYLQ